MTSRERPTSATATVVDRPAQPRAVAASGADRDFLSWEDLAQVLSPQQQQDLLALAAQQGFLHADQLPAIDPALIQQRRQLLTQLLSGKIQGLPAVQVPSVAVEDQALDAAQREAVARAVHTPDLCLIQGLPGSGKSRVAAEIVRQTVARGQRVLLLGATPAGLDRVLEQLGSRTSLHPLRCLHPGELLETMPPCAQRFTVEGQALSLRRSAMNAAEFAADAEKRLARRQLEHKVWEELATLAADLERLQIEAGGLACTPEAVAQRVEQAWQSLLHRQTDTPAAFSPQVSRDLLACLNQFEEKTRTCTARRTELVRRREQLDQDRPALLAERQPLLPRIQVWQQKQWWKTDWWRVLFNRSLLDSLAQLEQRLTALDQERAALEAELAQLDAEEARARTDSEAQRAALLTHEASRLLNQAQTEKAELDRQAEQLRKLWAERCRDLMEAWPLDIPSTDTVHKARLQWETLLQRDQQAALLSRRWAQGLEEAVPLLEQRLASFASVVAATPGGLAAENRLTAVFFDLLLVDEADLLSDPELLQAARRSRRWVLMGEPETPLRGRGSLPGRSVRSVAFPSAVFHRLWQQLHAAPRQLPIRWSRTATQLCCRLRPVPEDQRHWVECEPVVDCPEIELCILSVPRQEPVLVEVRFPSSMPVRQAKDFILQQLQEAAAHATGPAYLWTEDAGHLTVQTGQRSPASWSSLAGVERVPLTEGVQEVIRAPGEGSSAEVVLETLGFEFARSSGWDRLRAGAWLEAHLGMRDSGRTAYLGRIHRGEPGLNALLSDGLFRDGTTTLLHESGSELDLGRGLEWVPVPSQDRRPTRRSEPRRAGDSSMGRPPIRSGAGLEVDLSMAPAPDRLPGELRSVLPRQGLVNHAEALALVQYLETLLTDPVARQDFLAWQKRRLPADCICPGEALQNGHAAERTPVGGGHEPAIIVTALYDAQVRLLRLLVEQSKVLAQAGLTHLGEGHFRLGTEGVELLIDIPPALRQRECLLLCLSFTRSHSSRAVALGEQSAWLPLALTRCASRLILFGDLGTLQRRAQWASAVDHLDEVAASRERELIIHLLRGLPEIDLTPVSSVPVATPVRR